MAVRVVLSVVLAASVAGCTASSSTHEPSSARESSSPPRPAASTTVARTVTPPTPTPTSLTPEAALARQCAAITDQHLRAVLKVPFRRRIYKDDCVFQLPGQGLSDNNLTVSIDAADANLAYYDLVASTLQPQDLTLRWADHAIWTNYGVGIPTVVTHNSYVTCVVFTPDDAAWFRVAYLRQGKYDFLTDAAAKGLALRLAALCGDAYNEVGRP